MILEGLLNALLNLIPVFSLGLDISAAVAQIAAFGAYANYYFAIDTAAACAVAVLGVWFLCAVPSLVISLL